MKILFLVFGVQLLLAGASSVDWFTEVYSEIQAAGITTIAQILNVNHSTFQSSEIRFVLFSRHHFNQTVTSSNYSAVRSYRHKPLLVLIHGWHSNLNAEVVTLVTEGYLNKSDYSIIAVDWSYYARLDYISACSVISDIGRTIATFISELNTTTVRNSSNVQIIGHSLGAQIGGYTGQWYINSTRRHLLRITGLDPAGPLFGFPVEVASNYRLSTGDATHVDVIHTNDGLAGIAEEIGTADYYPNGGGPVQPGCGITNNSCAHGRSVLYYAESITDNNFLAVHCSNRILFGLGRCNDSQRVHMGAYEEYTNRGKYYLTTNSEFPFARGENGV